MGRQEIKNTGRGWKVRDRVWERGDLETQGKWGQGIYRRKERRQGSGILKLKGDVVGQVKSCGSMKTVFIDHVTWKLLNIVGW